MKILLLSAYDAASHKRWRTGLVKHCPEHDWTCLSLPARFFNWRVRGNSLSWAFSERETLEQDYDLLIATSMVDLSSLRGFVPKLATLPTVLYFHENQFDYPVSAKQKSAAHKNSVEPQTLSIYSALCATALVFNSDYNRQTFLKGAAALLKKLPDAVPDNLLTIMSERSSVLPVPLEDDCFQEHEAQKGEFQRLWNNRWKLVNNGVDPRGESKLKPDVRIVWNARHEYDKGPVQLLSVLRELERQQVNFSLALLGETFRSSPAEFQVIQSEFKHRLVAFGFCESVEDYRGWLASADVVLSTALHEFQGLAVLEGVARGCVPVLPKRQAYTELFDSRYLYGSTPGSPEVEAKDCVRVIQTAKDLSVPSITGYSWDALKNDYSNLFSVLTGKEQ